MNSLIAILQLALVSLGAFGVFALLLSYGRYRKMQLLAEDRAGEALTAPEAVLLVLSYLRQHRKSGQSGLLRLAGMSPESGPDLRTLLRGHIRKHDVVYLLAQGDCLILAQCPPENLPAMGERLTRFLSGQGMTSGRLDLLVPELNSQQIYDWIENTPVRQSSPGWHFYPAQWPYEIDPMPVSVSVDPLTGVLKTDRVPRALRRKFASMRRIGAEINLVKVDVDQLAAYNQAHGRECGDLILKTIAGLLMESCRETDLIGRLEEDAFILAMEGTAEDILQALRRMSERIKNTPLQIRESEIRFSAGFGMASMPRDGRNPLILMSAAGLALLEAKKRGRGLCLAYQASMKPTVSGIAERRQSGETF